jgi:hypothetical protein
MAPIPAGVTVQESAGGDGCDVAAVSVVAAVEGLVLRESAGARDASVRVHAVSSGITAMASPSVESART